MENRPCSVTGKVVHADNPDIEHWNKFKPAAGGKRGVTAWVEREGKVRVGDRVTLFVPDQRPWKYLYSKELMHFDMNKGEDSYASRIGMTAMTARMMFMMVLGMVLALFALCPV